MIDSINREIAAARCLLLVLSLTFAIACEGMPGASGAEPTVPWNQSAATGLAGQLATQMASLYTSAEKEPAFAGEQSAYGKTLDNLRILREESSGLHKELEDGKTFEQTAERYQRIKEVSRDVLESDSWEFLPTDFSAKSKLAFGVLDELDTFYGAR
jgi:hypothetical protein